MKAWKKPRERTAGRWGGVGEAGTHRTKTGDAGAAPCGTGCPTGSRSGEDTARWGGKPVAKDVWRELGKPRGCGRQVRGGR